MAIQIRRAVRPSSVRSIRKLAYSIATLAVCVAIGVVALAQAPGTWTPRASMSNPRQFPASGVIDGKLYVAGGNDNQWHNPDGSVAPGPGAGIVLRVPGMEIYDPILDTWSPGISMPTPLYAAASGGIGQRLYVAGGQAWPTVEPGINMARVQIFDTATSTWSFGTPMPQAVGGMASAVFDGKLYVAGGRPSGNTVNIGNLYIYDPVREHDGNPATNPWSSGVSMAPRQFAAATFFQGQMFVLGGEAGGALTIVQAYNPATDTWVTKAPLLTARYGMTAAVVDGRLYAIGGVNPPPHLNVVEVYDPAAGPAGADGRPIGAWSIAGPLPTPQTTPASAVIAGVLFLAGGMVDGTTFTGLTRAFSTSLDTDSDGLDDSTDPDDDGDGQSDADETACGSNPLSAASVSTDTDADHLPNCVDADDDGDGVSDAGDKFPLNAAESLDFDGDGLGNNGDPDDDNDGIPDVSDVFPFDALNVHPIFVVNSTADAVDALPGNGVCATAAGVCTLRAAVQEANALAGADAIQFSAGLNGTPITLTRTGAVEDAAGTGDLDATGLLTITGNGASNTIVRGCDSTAAPCTGIDRIFDIQAGGSVTISGLTAAYGNVSGSEGGGIRATSAVLTLRDSVVERSSASAYGGGLFVSRGITVIVNSSIAHNTGGLGGGGITNVFGSLTVSDSTVRNNHGAWGGGIDNNSGTTVANITIEGSTIADNTADYAGGLFNNGSGGTGTYRITNSTITGNSASVRAGGVLNSSGFTRLASVTVSSNRAPSGAGLLTQQGGAILARNTIVANSGGQNCFVFGTGAITSEGYNLSDDGSCVLTGTGDRTGVPAGLISLGSNGGPTQTHSLLGGSPAVDGGNPSGCTDTTGAALTVEQRGPGYPRAADGDGNGVARCDIGAVEALGVTADTDGDGVRDVVDAFPLNGAESVDTDLDGTGNNADLDDDNDGRLDPSDNCPLLANGPQTDTDGDGAGNACDPVVLPTFGAPTANTADGPASVAAGELNGDGKLDLVTANYLTNTVTVLLGDGAGGTTSSTTFASGGTLSNAGGATALGIADLNGDGKQDLAIAVLNAHGVVIRLGNGDGTFGVESLYRMGGSNSQTISVVVADLNLDGRVDLASANLNASNISVRFGDGAGGFGAALNYAVGSLPTGIAVGDLNGDARPDLVASVVGTQSVAALLGTDSGFAAATSYALGVNPSAVVIGDLNGDGHPDLITANQGANTVSVLLGNGNGGFSVPTQYGAGTGPMSVALADFNGDGRVDVAVTNSDASRSASVLLGNGQGGVGSPTNFLGPWAPPANPRLEMGITTADLDADGRPDLAFASLASNSVAIRLNAIDRDTDGDGELDSFDADNDNDGVTDGVDRFPLNAAESLDTDFDGTGNNADGDDDGDGVADGTDTFPLNAGESADGDGDGTGNNADLDDDNDTVPDLTDRFPLDASESADADNDGTGDNADLDDDNDGTSDLTDRFPLDATESADADNDGTGDNADLDDDNDGTPDLTDRFPLDASESADADNDGTGDNADLDDDNDGTPDLTDRFPLDATESTDADNDGTGDNADLDDDNDTVPDDTDVFPFDASESVDTDGDTIGNNADPDQDNDGVLNAADAFPLDRTESVDTDGDGTGDNADLDDDNDGFFDIIDGCRLVPGPANGCSPTEAVSNLEGNITALDLSTNSEGLLTNTLSNVDRALDSGNTAAARAQLRAFVNQVQSLQRRGQLSEAAATALIANADGIVAGL